MSKRTLKLTYYWSDAEGDWEEEIEVPAHWVICGICRGEGHHARHIDGNGLTQADMDELGDEFMEDYMAGRFDQVCSECGGTGKVLEPDVDRCTTEQLRAVDQDAERRYAEYQETHMRAYTGEW